MKISCLSIATEKNKIMCGLFSTIIWVVAYAPCPLRKLFFRSNGTHQVVVVVASSAEVTAISFHKFIVKFEIYDSIKAGICGEFRI